MMRIAFRNGYGGFDYPGYLVKIPYLEKSYDFVQKDVFEKISIYR